MVVAQWWGGGVWKGVVMMVVLVVGVRGAEVTWNGGVIEFAPVVWEGEGIASCDTVRNITSSNLLELSRMVKKAVNEYGAQMVVFGEYSLQGPNFPSRESALPFLVDLTGKNATCPGILEGLVGIAKSSHVDIVANVGEVKWCMGEETDCPSDGRFQYNSQVAILRTGEISAVYRKSHLYYEPAFDPNPDPTTPVLFTTSFGIRVGLLICFDLMHDTPTLSLFSKTDTIAYSTWWPTYPPLLSGAQTQSSFASKYSVNFLAAGSGSRGWHLSGSGIYPHASFPSQPSPRSHTSPSPNTTTSTLITLQSIVSKSATQSIHRQQKHQQKQKPHHQHPPLPSLLNPHLSHLPSSNTSFVMNVSGFVAGGKIDAVKAEVEGVECVGNFVVEGDGSAEVFAVIAATGLYNGIFQASFCALLPCPTYHTDPSACFETDQTVVSNTVFRNASLDVKYDRSKWKSILAQGAHTTLQTILAPNLVFQHHPLDGTANLIYQSHPQHTPLLTLNLLGLQWG